MNNIAGLKILIQDGKNHGKCTTTNVIYKETFSEIIEILVVHFTYMNVYIF